MGSFFCLFSITISQLNGEVTKKAMPPNIRIFSGRYARAISLPQTADITDLDSMIEGIVINIARKVITPTVLIAILRYFEIDASLAEIRIGNIAFMKNVGITKTTSNILYASE